MNVKILMVGCIYICLCIVLFDLLFALSVRWNEWRQPRREQKLKAILQDNIDDFFKNGQDFVRQRRMERLLLQENNILALIDIIQPLQMTAPQQLQQYLAQNIKMFVRLAVLYQKKAPEYRALFYHTVCILNYGNNEFLCSGEEKSQLHELAAVILPDVLAQSVYVHENAMRALANLGNTKDVLHAMHLLNLKKTPLHTKLISENLLRFSGLQEELMEALWQEFDAFRSELQVSILQYMCFLPPQTGQSRYRALIYTRLNNENTDGEVRIACIRFFRRNVYAPAQAVLLQMLGTSGGYYNYAAVAATALRSYPGVQTEQALLRQMSNPDWYVRFNCAESLLFLQVDYENIILHSEDRYAKEMLLYRAEIAYLQKHRAEVQTW